MLETHPLRGPLFENLVFLEILKRSLNRGHAPRLSFFRDKTGREVDFIIESGESVQPIEVKCTHTFRAEYTDGIRVLEGLLGSRVSEPMLLHAGEEHTTQTHVQVRNALQYFLDR